MKSLHDIYVERLSVWSDVVEHLEYFHDVVVETGAETVVELGVRSGNSTAAFLAALEQTGGHLWSVDIRLPQVPAEFRRSALWSLILGDDLTVADLVAPIDTASFGWAPDIDILFIDSSHHYDHTLAELRLYGPRATLILLHDTELEHPDGAPPEPSFPVKTAVEEWCSESGRAWRNLTNCYGLGIIGG